MSPRTLSTRALLILLMTIAAFGALLTAGAVMLSLEMPRTRNQLSRELDSLAHLLGNRSSAALVFRDDATARENLRSLAGLPQIARACLFLDSGELLASFPAEASGPDAGLCVAQTPLATSFVEHDGFRVRMQVPIEEAGRAVGAIALMSTSMPLRERLFVQGASLGVALAVALMLAVLMAMGLQRFISRPIGRVREVVDAVIHHGDMTLRAPEQGPREIGQLAGAFNRMLDTVQRQNDDLASREAYSRRLFHESHTAQMVIDEHGLCHDCNLAAAQLFGASQREELQGLGLRTLFVSPTDADPDHGMREWHRPAGASRPWRIEASMQRRGASAWQAEIDVVPFESDSRALMHCTLHDASARHATQAARQAQLTAEAASRAKTEFLSRMSHELRTPLNAALGFIQLVQRDAAETLTDGVQRQLQLAQQAGWHLLALIDDTLDVARIEAGKLELAYCSVLVAEALDEALAFNEAQADEAGVRLHRSYRQRPALAVRADMRRLRQILLNLVSNAIKYNRHGGDVSVEVAAADGRVSITVVDNGIGISAEQHGHLFEPFNRLGRESSTIVGTGIGLALSRHLAELMGGELQLRSAPDRGTQACLTLPAAPAESARPDIEPDALISDATSLRARVLYIEDNPINMLLVEQCLSVLPGLELITAETGTEGIDRLLTHRPDLVLLDMQLPDVSGIEVLARIEALRPGLAPRVIALSASAMPSDVQQALEAGAADYWTKPIDVSRFVVQVCEALADAGITPRSPLAHPDFRPASAQAD